MRPTALRLSFGQRPMTGRPAEARYRPRADWRRNHPSEGKGRMGEGKRDPRLAPGPGPLGPQVAPDLSQRLPRGLAHAGVAVLRRLDEGGDRRPLYRPEHPQDAG